TLIFAPDGKTVVTANGWQLQLTLWDVATGKALRRFEAKAIRAGGPSIAFSPDGKTLLAAGKNNTAYLWEVASGKLRPKFSLPMHQGTSGWAAFSADARTLAYCAAPFEGTMRLHDVPSGREVARLQGHLAPVTTFVFLPDGRHLLSGSKDTTMLLWHVRPS